MMKMNANESLSHVGSVLQTRGLEKEYGRGDGLVRALDGVDLASKAEATTSGVSRASSQEPSFETVRATRIGLTVAAEVRRRAS